MTHAELSEAAVRPPGTPPSTCPGELRRVDGAGNPIDPSDPPMLDICLPREGAPTQFSVIRLWRCDRCHSTLVEARAPDRTTHQRNSWAPATWDGAAGRAVAMPAPAVA